MQIRIEPSPMTAANPWLVSVRGAVHTIPGWLALGWTAVLAGFTVLTLAPLIDLWLPAPGHGLLAVTSDRALSYLLLFGGFFATGLVGVFWERRPRREGGAAFWPSTLIGLGIGMGCLAATLVLVCLVGVAKPAGAGNSAYFGLTGIILAGALVLFQCWAEEALFRGWLQPLLAERWGVGAGLIVTSATFGLAHSVHTPGVLAILNAILAGVLFGLLALKTGGLAAPVAAHFGYNWAEQSIFGLTPNPGVDEMGSVFDFNLSGPSILSGGQDELNGSILLCLTLGCAIYLVARFRSAGSIDIKMTPH